VVPFMVPVTIVMEWAVEGKTDVKGTLCVCMHKYRWDSAKWATEGERSIYECIHLTVHFATAACTNFDMSSFACFFALSVIPSSLSSAPGDVSSGSNSRRWPSRVGKATRAAMWPPPGLGATERERTS
jgi:hypothetical protein